MNINDYCHEPFWNETSSWDTSHPVLSRCFRMTIFRIAPCFLLWFLASPEVYILGFKMSVLRPIPWSFVNSSRILFALVAIIINAIELGHLFKNQDFESIPLVDITSPVILVASFLLISIILIGNRVKGVIRSPSIWIFYAISTVFEGINLYQIFIDWTNIRLEEYYLGLVYFPTLVLSLLFVSIPDKRPIASGSRDNLDSNDKVCPLEEASYPSVLTFAWTYPLFWFGFKHDMTKDDVLPLLPEDKANSVGSHFRRFLFKKQAERVRNDTLFDSQISVVHLHDNLFQDSEEVLILPADDTDLEIKVTKKNSGVVSALFKSFKGELAFTAILQLFYELTQLSNPWLLKWLLNFVERTEGKEWQPLWHGVLIILLMFFFNIVMAIFHAKYFYVVYALGNRVKSSLQSSIYRKAMTISNSVRKKTTVGEMVNLMSVDADRFEMLMSMINLIWSCPLQVGIIIYLLYLEIGVSCFGGLIVLLLVLPINYYTSHLMEKAVAKQMELKDIRVKSMNEILNGIKVLKLYGWEPAFMKQILGLRDKELKKVIKVSYLEAVFSFMWTSAPLFVALASFALYVTIDEHNILNAEKVFVSLLLFNLLRQPLANLPYMITTLVMVIVSVKRLNRFFGAQDLEEYVTRHHDDYAVSFEDASFTWGANVEEDEDFLDVSKEKKKSTNEAEFKKSSENGAIHSTLDSPNNIHSGSSTRENCIEPKKNFELKDININVVDQSLVAVVGVVGSGKSSLLNALLGEMQRITGGVNIAPRIKSVAYVSQQAWIQNISLRDNILFGKKLHENKYQEIVKLCELKPDLEILPAGDMTEIGEKGINLSGGQKQRLNLARACYSDADLFLLDDPLSAVDSHVAKNLFDNVIGPKGILRKKTRILVTNHLSILPRVDQIIVMKEGKISETGTYKELIRQDGEFSDFIKTFSNNSCESTPVTPTTSPVKIPDFTRSRSLSVVSDIGNLSANKQGNSNFADAGALIDEENIEKGSVKWSVYYQYYRVLAYSTIIVLCMLASQGAEAGTSVWLALWSQDKPLNSTEGNPVIDAKLRNERLTIYGLLGVGSALILFIAEIILARGAVKASKTLHENMLLRILRSPMSFFETTPTGRIVNRFSKDIDTLDVWLANTIMIFALCCLQIITTFAVIVFAIPIFIVVIIPTTVIYIIIQKFYVTTQRQVKRLESATRSPIYSHFSETLNGASTIRAYGTDERFIVDSDNKIDASMRCTWTLNVLSRWLEVSLGLISSTLILFAGLFAVLSRETMDPGLTGLAVTYAISVGSYLSWFVEFATHVETEIVAVERVLEYSNVATEAEWIIDSNKPPQGWPNEGAVEFQGLSTRYREGLDFVLHDVSLKIEPSEKIGIVGRTGSGKSTITLSLLRMIEATKGKIIIDGLDISKIGLHDLRTNITIIPQDPVLFSGTLRFNLDPFTENTDDELWKSLELAHLKDFVRGLEKELDCEVSEGGTNLSVGQRQLLCMARALLRKTKLLILDEATAAIDMETDSLIQKTIRSEFANCTVLTIAHRLHSILESSRVLVVDSGKVVEFDKPQVLLDDPNSIFYSLAKDAGISSNNF